MTASTRTVREHLATLGAWDGADVRSMPADEALAAFEAGAQALHALQAVVARFAARIDVVCEQSPGTGGYARRRGYASGPALLAARAGMAPGEVNRLAHLGRGLLAADAAADAAAERAEREAFERAQDERAVTWAGGDATLALAPGALAPREDSPLGLSAALEPSAPIPPQALTPPQASEPPQAPAPQQSPTPARALAPGEYLARAVDAGRVGPAHAEVITATLADFTIDSREAEREFVDLALHVGIRKLKAHCFWRLGELDPRGLALREARQRKERFFSVSEGPDGTLTFFGKTDVVTGAPIKALLESMTSAALRRQRKQPKRERLTPGQLMADALSDVALHATSCEQVPKRPKFTVVVRIDKSEIVNDLRDAGLVDEDGLPTSAGRGLATCDGILQPITAATARLMAVEAQLMPAVMGGESLPLDLGRAQRLFTKHQKLAIADRDRGCIRCSAPPAFCHTHHLTFWSDDGPTDVSNGVLLCTGCHHRLHEQRWTLARDGDRYRVVEQAWPGSGTADRSSSPPRERQPNCPDRHPLAPVA